MKVPMPKVFMGFLKTTVFLLLLGDVKMQGTTYNAVNPEPNDSMAIAAPPMPEDLHMPPETIIAPLLVKPKRYTTFKTADRGANPYQMNRNPLMNSNPYSTIGGIRALQSTQPQKINKNSRNFGARSLMQNINFNSISEPVEGIEDKLQLSEDRRSRITPQEKDDLDSQKANEDLSAFSNDNDSFGLLADTLHDIKMNVNDLHELIRVQGIILDQKMEKLRKAASKYRFASIIEIN